MRLNKYLAEATGFSRREIDEFITSGQVKINNQPAQLGARISEDDAVKLKDRIIKPAKTPLTLQHTTLLINKPVGYVSSRRGQGKPTIYELLPEQYQNLKTVGRLDHNSSGLILLTNDGDLAFQLTHPKFAKTKIYEVSLDQPLAPLHQQMISDFGITLNDGVSQLVLERIDDTRKNWRVQLREGRNRQIRRTFRALNYTTTKIHRTHFGTYALDALAEGKYREA